MTDFVIRPVGDTVYFRMRARDVASIRIDGEDWLEGEFTACEWSQMYRGGEEPTPPMTLATDLAVLRAG